MARPKPPTVPLTPEQQKLAEDNIKFAHFMANKLKGHSYMEFDDLDAVCMEGLCRAARSYDPNKGIAFSSYASVVIHNWHKIQHRAYCRWQKCETLLEDLSPYKNEGDMSWDEWLSAGQRLNDDIAATNVTIQKALASVRLTKNQRMILALKFNNPEITQREIAKILNISRTTVWDLLKEMRAKLTKKLAS